MHTVLYVQQVQYLLSDTFLGLQFLQSCDCSQHIAPHVSSHVYCLQLNFIKSPEIVKQSYPRLMHAEILKSCAMNSIFKKFRSKKSYKWHEMSIFQTELNKGNLQRKECSKFKYGLIILVVIRHNNHASVQRLSDLIADRSRKHFFKL